MDRERTEMTATIPANVGKAATRSALLALHVQQLTDALKAARGSLREQIEATDAWNEADGMRREIAKNTAETRKEIAAQLKAARASLASTPESQHVEQLADALRMARVHLADELRESRQMLMPFARECGVEL